MKKKTPSLYCISNFEGTSYKKLQFTAISNFISYCFTSAYISVYFLQHFRSLFNIISKKDFRREFFFFIIFIQTHPIPLTAKIRKKRDESFLSMLPYYNNFEAITLK